MSRILLLFVVSAWYSVSFAEALAPFSASYALIRGGIKIGIVQRELRQDENGDFLLTARSTSTGIAALFVKDIITETSRFHWHEGRPRPLNYSYDRSGGKRERHVKLWFDWEAGKVTNDISGDAWVMEVPPTALDKLLYQIVLMLDLRTQAKSFNYDVADGGKMKDYHFRVVGKEALDTTLGRLEVVKLTRRREDRVTTIWCAKDYDFLPVRIEQNEEDHGNLRLSIESVSGIEKRP